MTQELCITAALVFAAAAMGKFGNPAGFRRVLAGYRLLPAPVIGPAARALPVLEASVALLLPFRLLHSWPRLLAASLLLLFAGAMAVNLLRGHADIACGCAPAAGQRHGLRWPSVGINVALAGALLCAPAAPVPTMPQTLTACLAGTALFLLIQAGNAIFALGPIARRTTQARFQ